MILLGILLLIVATIVGIIFWRMNVYVNQYDDDKVAAGIYIEGIALEGMTESQVEAVMEGLVEDRGSAIITLITTEPEETETEVSLLQLGLSDSNGDVIMEEVMSCGKTGSIYSRYITLVKTKRKEINYDLNYEIDSTLISEFVDTTYAEMIHSPVDATLEFASGSPTVVADTEGVKIDVEQAIVQIESYMSEAWDGESGSIYLTTAIVEADVTQEMLEGATDVLGSYETYCANSGNRWDNVARGAELVNGTIVLPGEEFVFSEAVHPFTEENGYANAGSYSDGEVVDSMAGGICQVSTTLYNAALYAELEVTQRSAHSMLVSYVDEARDAAIAGDYKDLKFVNNTDSPIYIYADLSGTSLVFTIYGEETRDENRTIELESVVTENNGYGDPEFEENSDLTLGSINKVSSGYIGKVAELWKYVYIDGELDSEVKINTSTYNSSSETYEVGTKSSSSAASKVVQTAIATQDEDKIDAAIDEAKEIIAEEEAEAQAEAEADTAEAE